MEATEKIRLLLQHWISHNESHAEEYRKWQAAADDAGLATAIAGAAEAMTGVNEHLRQALALVGGGADSGITDKIAAADTGHGEHHHGHCGHGGRHHHHDQSEHGGHHHHD